MGEGSRLSDGQIVAFVTGLVAVAQVSISIYLPSMPAMTAAFGTDAATIQLTFTAYMLGAAVAQLVIGPLSDRFGRRPVLLVGLGVYSVATFAAALSSTVEVLIWARLVQSIGATTGPVIGRAIVRDRFDRTRAAQVMAHVGLALAISPALAPLIGAFVHDLYGWQANFILVGLFGLTVLMVSWRSLEETNLVRQTDASALQLTRNFGRLLANQTFLAYALSSSLMFGALFAFFSEGPFVFMVVLGASSKAYAIYSALTVVGFAVGSYLTGRYTLKLGIDRLIVIGIAVALVGAAVLVAFAIAGVVTPFAIIGPLTLFVFGLALLFPTGTAGALSVHPEIAGTASALLGFVQMGMAGLATLAAGHFSNGTEVPMVSVISLGVVAGALAYGIRFLWRCEGAADTVCPHSQ